MNNPLRTLKLSLATLILGVATASAQLPPPPSGFEWELQSSNTYSDNDSFGTSLGATQSLAPAASPVVSSLSETLSLTSFDAAGTEASMEASMPGMDFAIVVLSSTYTASLDVSASSQIFNFDSAFAPHDYNGTTSASSFQISGAGSAGPATDSLVNTAFNVGGFMIGDFADGTSGATTATIDLDDAGLAPTDGSAMNFAYSGSAVLALFSDDPSAANQFANMTSNALGSAEVMTDYEVYKLIPAPVPEPGSAVLALFGTLLILRRRR